MKPTVLHLKKNAASITEKGHHGAQAAVITVIFLKYLHLYAFLQTKTQVTTHILMIGLVRLIWSDKNETKRFKSDFPIWACNPTSQHHKPGRNPRSERAGLFMSRSPYSVSSTGLQMWFWVCVRVCVCPCYDKCHTFRWEDSRGNSGMKGNSAFVRKHEAESRSRESPPSDERFGATLNITAVLLL